MKLYHLIDTRDNDREIGFVEWQEGDELVFSDDATRDLLIAEADPIPPENPEAFLAACMTALEDSGFVRLRPAIAND
jgi:hypothetical protein